MWTLTLDIHESFNQRVLVFLDLLCVRQIAHTSPAASSLRTNIFFVKSWTIIFQITSGELFAWLKRITADHLSVFETGHKFRFLNFPLSHSVVLIETELRLQVLIGFEEFPALSTVVVFVDFFVLLVAAVLRIHHFVDTEVEISHLLPQRLHFARHSFLQPLEL